MDCVQGYDSQATIPHLGSAMMEQWDIFALQVSCSQVDNTMVLPCHG